MTIIVCKRVSILVYPKVASQLNVVIYLNCCVVPTPFFVAYVQVPRRGDVSDHVFREFRLRHDVTVTEFLALTIAGTCCNHVISDELLLGRKDTLVVRLGIANGNRSYNVKCEKDMCESLFNSS
jgi:hypothetical protein